MGKRLKVLALSDVELSFVYNPASVLRFAEVGLVIGCGDLSYVYIEQLVNALSKPTYYVRGNHAFPVEMKLGVQRTRPWGATDLHRRVLRDPSGLLLAGFEGSLRYNRGDYQYTQGEMWGMVLQMTPRLLLNRLHYGRYLDVLVTHAPPWGIHDQLDLPHQGIRAFRWLLQVFQPAVHFHGHVHVINPLTRTASRFHNTHVYNVFGYREQVICLNKGGARPVEEARRG